VFTLLKVTASVADSAVSYSTDTHAVQISCLEMARCLVRLNTDDDSVSNQSDEVPIMK